MRGKLALVRYTLCVRRAGESNSIPGKESPVYKTGPITR